MKVANVKAKLKTVDTADVNATMMVPLEWQTQLSVLFYCIMHLQGSSVATSLF